MTGGALFVVILPRKELEIKFRNKEKAAQIIRELNESKSDHKLSIETEIKENGATLPKCNSTACLQDNEKCGGLFKSVSEAVIEGSNSSDSARSSMIASWGDLKQIIRPKKNKLKITNPESLTDVLSTFNDDSHLETILLEIIKRLNIVNASWTLTKNNEFWQVIFSVNNNIICEETLQVLRTFGLGSKYQSSVSIIPCALYYQSQSDEELLKNKEAGEHQNLQDGTKGQPNDHNSAWTKFTSSVSARNNLAQVLQDVRSDAALTFDWLNLLIIASLVAAIGLVENSVVILVASMLISPLMGPITAGTIGTIIQDRSLQRLGLQSEITGMFLAVIIGFIFGLAICALDETYGIENWPTTEMMSRCTIRSIWINVAVAIPSGVGVALAVLGEYTASLVGVAISASLLPPAVNAGLLWAMALVHFTSVESDVNRWSGVVARSLYSSDPAKELAILGAVSLCLTVVNIVCIFLAGVAVYKVKDVSPFQHGYISWWRASRTTGRPTRSRDRQMDNTTAWDLHRWYNESKEINGNSQPPLEAVQSDTVTYRNNSSRPRTNVQNMQDLYVKQTQNDSLRNSHNPSETAVPNESTDSMDQNTDTSCSTQDSLEKNKNQLDNNPKFRKVSFGPNQESKIPIIEPSSNLTIDERKRELFLSSKGNK